MFGILLISTIPFIPYIGTDVLFVCYVVMVIISVCGIQNCTTNANRIRDDHREKFRRFMSPIRDSFRNRGIDFSLVKIYNRHGPDSY